MFEQERVVNGKRFKRVVLYIPVDWWHDVCRAAEAQHMSSSELAERWIIQCLGDEHDAEQIQRLRQEQGV